jgi:predicted amidohydrolase YtcJ
MPYSTLESVDTIYFGFKIWTGDSTNPWAEALAVKDGKIVAVGTNEEIESKYHGSKTVTSSDYRIKSDGPLLMTPGFHDCHVHLLMGGHSLSAVQLRDAQTKEEMVLRISEFASKYPEGSWIQEGYWNHENWGGDLPTHDLIDAVTPNNPVFVWRLDGHMGLANQLALDLAGITKDTVDPPGGEIVRAVDGTPTGILKDKAMGLVHSVIPPPSIEADDRALQAALNHVAQYGITSVHHMGTFEDLEVFSRAWRANKLTTRIYAAVPLHHHARLAKYIQEQEDQTKARGDAWLRWGNLKGFTDGSLGSHTALMFDPYEDDPPATCNCQHKGDIGLLINPIEDLIDWTVQGDKSGLQISLHAIGDRAISIALDAFNKARTENNTTDNRFRIEHAQHVSAKNTDMDRFADLGVVASMQPYHLIDDGQWAEKIIGPKRAKTTLPFRSLLNAGVKLAFGSDWFVAPPVPLYGIYSAVTRSTLDGKHPDGWVPSEKTTVEEALRAFTVDGAYASFEEKTKGKLAVGMLADLVVIDKDITTLSDPHDIWNAKVLETVVDGKSVYRAL